MERGGPVLPRREFLKLTAGVALSALLTGCTRVAYPPYYKPSPLEDSLKTPLRSDKIGLVNENIFQEDEKPGGLGNFIFAFNPLTPTTWIPHGGVEVPVFANDPNYGHFRQSRGTILNVYRRTREALAAGKKIYAVFSVLGIEEGKIAEGAKLLLLNGVKNFIIGNEPNVEDQGIVEGNKPENVLRAARIIRKEADELGIDVNLSPPGLAHYGSGEYLHELVAKAGSDYPFVGVNDHYYGTAKDYSSRVWMMRKKMEHLGLKNPYRVTEIGNPVDLYKEHVSHEELAKGGVILRLLEGAALETVGEQFWYCALDWGRPEHSLMREVNGRLVPNDSYIAYRLAGRLANGIVESEIDFSSNSTLAVHARRNDGINFTVIASIKEDKAVDLRLQPGDAVFNTKGEPTREWGYLRLSPPAMACLNGEERIIIHQ